MKLVEIRKFDLVTNSLAIAQGVRRDHDTIIKLIDRNREDLEEFGRAGLIRPFQTNGGMQKQRVALLNEQQTTLLITYMRNNYEVRAFKKILVKEFFRMRVIELERKRKHRESARLGYPHMMKSLAEPANKDKLNQQGLAESARACDQMSGLTCMIAPYMIIHFV